MMVLLTNARAEDSKDVDQELLNKEDEEVILTETLEKTKDAFIYETDIGDDQQGDDENAI